MKRILNSTLAILMLAMPLTGLAQGRNHQGFYLSMQAGPAMGYINGYNNQQTSLRVEGTGVGFDLQIGGAVKENVILQGVIGVKSIYGPTISVGGIKSTVSQDYSFDEVIFGGGATYYLKNNFFLAGNMGLGSFTFSDESTNTSVDTDNGFSYQLKAGKEWWVSPRWALGVAVEYSGTRTETQTNNYSETWQSHRYSIRFTATMNGRK